MDDKSSGLGPISRGEMPVRLRLAVASSPASDQTTPGPAGGSPSYPTISEAPPYSPSRPCTLCCDLSQDCCKASDPADGRNLRRLSMTQVSRSAQQGCRGCRILSDGIGILEPELAQLIAMSPEQADGFDLIQRLGYTVFVFEGGVPRRDKVINVTRETGAGLCVTYNFRNGETDSFGTAVDLDFFVTEESPWTKIRPSCHISGDTSSEASFLRAQKWLEKCTREHKSCGEGFLSSPLPDRVLDLGISDSKENCGITLIETRNKLATYACLSHCWGDSQHLTTTLGTIGQRKSGIEWESLPLTFRDAVTFTRRLNIRYLWIDSLCIIQDSLKDWNQQAAKMPEMYGKGYITLTASGAPDGDTGCFSASSPLHKSRQVTTTDREGNIHHVFVRQHLPHWILPYEQKRMTRLRAEFPILERGWVLQERLLSPRVLHFGKHELLWECSEATACECAFLDGVPDAFLPKMLHDRGLQGLQEADTRTSWYRGQVMRSDDRDLALRSYWRRLVEQYTHLQLTKPTDKLPAFAGMAAQFNARLSFGSDVYLAGLWRNSLPRDLLWKSAVARPFDGVTELPAPSWSWASSVSAVTFLDGGERPLPQERWHLDFIQEIIRVDDVDNPYGRARVGRLAVAAPLMEVMIAIFTPTPSSPRPEPGMGINGVMVNDPPVLGAGIVAKKVSVDLDVAYAPTTSLSGDVTPGVSTLVDAQAAYLFRVATMGKCEYSLLLMKDPTTHYPVYQRAGIVTEILDSSAGGKPSRIPWYDHSLCPVATISLD